jgi:hypothetical protein
MRCSCYADHAALAMASLFSPRATILRASSGKGRCNAFASSHGARIHTSRSSCVVRISAAAYKGALQWPWLSTISIAFGAFLFVIFAQLGSHPSKSGHRKLAWSRPRKANWRHAASYMHVSSRSKQAKKCEARANQFGDDREVWLERELL